MKHGNNGTYKVLTIDGEGEVRADKKVYKTFEGAVRRLQQLVLFEEQQLLAGFGEAHEYRIKTIA